MTIDEDIVRFDISVYYAMNFELGYHLKDVS